MKLKIILFNLSIIIFLICLIYLYIYVNYKYEGFEDPTAPPVAGSSGEVFRPEGARQDPITDKTTESNVLNDVAAIAKINPTLSELEKIGVSEETAISSRVIPYFNVSRTANNKSPISDGYYWVDFSDTNLTNSLLSYAGATLNSIAGSKDQYLLYKSSGSLVITEDYLCDILVVGGGGSGGSRHGGGGGAGAVVYKTNVTLSAGVYTMDVGNGGAAVNIGGGLNPGPQSGNNGENSSISRPGINFYLAQGGGGGGANFGPSIGKSGGSSGGTNGGVSKVSSPILTNNVPDGSFGNIGGKGSLESDIENAYSGGGGGGAGSRGGDANQTNVPGIGGNGGNGIEISITGTPTYYGGGGGGGTSVNGNSAGSGGLGGGGAGSKSNVKATNGTPNTGGGGGGSGFHPYGYNQGESGAGGSGVIIIRLKQKVSTMGKKYVYCLMDKNYFGGGWMLAMRAVRGSKTFGYNSEHWTTATTLNDTVEKIGEVKNNADLSISSIGDAILNNYEDNTDAINRYDAKFDTFNRYKANEWMAIFYFKNDNGVVLKGGDSISGGNRTAKGWVWRETNLLEADKIERTPLQLFQKRNNLDRYYSLIDLRGNYGVKNAKELPKFKPVENMPLLWSSQHGYNFYGINYDVPEFSEMWNRRGASTRWGFAWNENWNYSTNNQSNDVYGGIGLRFPGAGQPGYSAGDFIYCCEEFRGANSSIAFEWYVR